MTKKERKEMMRVNYIAYGSNLNVEQMKSRCFDAKKVGTAVIEDYKLTFRGTQRGTGFANIERCKGSTVPVGIWNISRYDEMDLDIYEGYPSLYMKDYIEFIYNDKTYIGLAYIMHPGHPVLEPAKWYLDKIIQGYADFGIHTKWLNEALENCKEMKKYDNDWKKYYSPYEDELIAW